MPLLILLVGLLLPRVVIFILWLFTGWFNNVFGHWVILLLGFIFLPYTTLWYSAVINWFGGTWGIWQILIMALAIIADIVSMVKRRF